MNCSPWQPGYPTSDTGKDCGKMIRLPNPGFQNDDCEKRLPYVCIRKKSKLISIVSVCKHYNSTAI